MWKVQWSRSLYFDPCPMATDDIGQASFCFLLLATLKVLLKGKSKGTITIYTFSLGMLGQKATIMNITMQYAFETIQPD